MQQRNRLTTGKAQVAELRDTLKKLCQMDSDLKSMRAHIRCAEQAGVNTELVKTVLLSKKLESLGLQARAIRLMRTTDIRISTAMVARIRADAIIATYP